MAKVVRAIQIGFDEREVIEGLHVDRMRGREGVVSDAIGMARSLIDPKGAYAIESVKDIRGGEVQLDDGHVFDSIILSDILQRGQRVAPYVVTIGPKLEEAASQLAKDDVFRSWALEKVGDYAVGKAAIAVRSIVEDELGGKVSGFGPGTGTGRLFAIEQQKVLFGILDPEKNIGVKLTPNWLMVPRKSASGVFAVTASEYVACQYCPKECGSRRKPFQGEYLWNEVEIVPRSGAECPPEHVR